MSDPRKVKIDGIEIEVPPHYTVLQACEEAGIEVPRFCYHERLSVAGNCRMCLVEVKGGPPKPQASCALGVSDLRPGPEGQPPEIFTTTPMVKKAREGVMEFLLINHPLDCPICDQGGECDLQDQAMAYGTDKNRFVENKRAVEDKYMGPVVKTTMSRCIHCTRCVRFTTEVGGVEDLGLAGRGENAEITTYLEKAMTSELQGNVIDLCPVGALTSRPYAFQARPWELKKTETIDVMDALGSAIRVDARGGKVLRIMPRLNEEVNEEWISDKARFVCDGLASQRLDQPYVRKRGKLEPATWDEAFAAIAKKIKSTPSERIGAIAGDLCAAEEMAALKDLMTALDVTNIDCRQDGTLLGQKGGRVGYLFNPGIAGINDADAILIVGSNPRLEAPVLNARIRQSWRNHTIPIGLIGEQGALTYDYDHLGAGAATLKSLVDGKNKFHSVLKKAKRPLIIVGQGALARSDGLAILGQVAKLAKKVGAIKQSGAPGQAAWNGFSVLHTAASRVAGLDLGILPAKGGMNTADMLSAAKKGAIDVMFLLGADEINMNGLGDAFVIYQGSHGDAGANRADVILPGAAYTEKSATYVNTEGRVQMTNRAVFPPGDAREDWTVLRALSAVLGSTLPYDTVDELRAKMYETAPQLAMINRNEPADTDGLSKLAKLGGKLNTRPFASTVADFYLTNPVARASAVMAECSALRRGRKPEAAE